MKANSSHLRIVALIVLGLGFGSGCIDQELEETTAITATLDTPFQLQLNQTVFITSENLKIHFTNVTEDSRCPSDAQCIWAGRATIAVTIFKNEQSLGVFNLSTESDYDAIISFETYTLMLAQLDPYPALTETISTSDYVVTLLLSSA